MTRAFTVWTMELAPGVTEEEFERFLTEEWPSYVHPKGRTGGWCKGIRGKEEGKYLSYCVYEDYEAFRKRYFTTEGNWNEEAKRHDEAYPGNAELMEKFKSLSVGWGEEFTDYLDIEIDYLTSIE